MWIFLDAATPQGALCNCHRLQKVEITAEAVFVTINSYAGEDVEIITWQDVHKLPFTAIAEGSYPQNIFDYLTGAEGPFTNGVLVAEQEELEKLKLTTKARVNTLREERIAGGVNVPGIGIIDSDDLSIRNVGNTVPQAILALMTNSPFTITWRLKDNTEVELDAEDMVAMQGAGAVHASACYAHSWALKAAIDDAADVDAVRAIDIMAGWPEV